jgi:hypothetical protein
MQVAVLGIDGEIRDLSAIMTLLSLATYFEGPESTLRGTVVDEFFKRPLLHL